jgi:hypothetical protein
MIVFLILALFVGFLYLSRPITTDPSFETGFDYVPFEFLPALIVIN